MNPNRLDGMNELPIDVRNRAMWMHLAGLLTVVAGYFFSLFALLIPYFIWNSVRDEHPFVEENSRNSTNFHTSVAIYSIILVLVLAMIIFAICGGFFAFPGSSNSSIAALLGIAFWLVPLLLAVMPITCVSLSIYGALRARNGQVYRYPFTIEFLKPKHRAND
jgi:uncharacterized protein